MPIPEIHARELLNLPLEGGLPREMTTRAALVAQGLREARADAIQETLRILESATPAEWYGMSETHRGAREALLGCVRRVQALLK
jgi:hypothetical protein